MGEDAPVPPVRAGASPSSQVEMTRAASSSDDFVDPVRVLASVEEKQMREMQKMNVKELSRFFASLGLREIPEQVRRHGLNGAILHTLTDRDIEKMGFETLGEAKALENLARALNKVDREQQRELVITERDVAFWGDAHVWYDGPLSMCNRCAMKDHRTNCDQCWDAVCCAPKDYVELPESKLAIYRDHLTITYPKWKDHVRDKYRKLNHAFVDTNEPPFKVIVDNIDFSQIRDVDVEIVTKQAEYVRHCSDCTNVLLCKTLKREPHEGDFYWAGPCQQLCGYDLFYKHRPEGYITITLKNADEAGNGRRIGVLADTDSAAKAIMHHMEEAQMLRQVKLQ